MTDRSPRKRQKLDNDAIPSLWDDDDVFLLPDTLSALSQYDVPIQNQTKPTADKPKPLAETLTNLPSTSAIVPSASLFADEVIKETPMYPNRSFDELLRNLENSQIEIHNLTEARNTAVAEIRVVRDRCCGLEKEKDRDVMKMSELIRSNQQALKEAEDKYRAKIDRLETNIQFRDLEFQQMHQQLKRRRTEAPGTSMEASVQCNIVPLQQMKELNLEISRGEVSVPQLIPHLTCYGDGVFSFSRDETSIAPVELSDSPTLESSGSDNVIQSSIISPPEKIDSARLDVAISPDLHLENATGSLAPAADLKLAVIDAFLSSTNFVAANIDAGFDVLLGILEKRLRACAETWPTRSCAKPACKTSSAESIFSSVASSTSTPSSVSMTRTEFSVFERDEISILNYLWKIMKARPSLLEKATDPRPKSTLFCTTFQRDGGLVDLSRNGDTLGKSLAKLIQLPNCCCEKFAAKHWEDAVVRVLRVLTVVVGVNVSLGAVQDLVECGGVLFCLDVGVGADVLIACLEFVDACVNRLGSLSWLCNYSKEICYVSRMSVLCNVPVTSSSSDQSRLQLLGKIIDLMMKILKHSEGLDWLLREPGGCNCSFEIVNQLILALCTEATNCNPDIDGYRFRVLSKGIQFLHWLSLSDSHFPARRHKMALEYNLLVRRMSLLCQDAGRTTSVVEMQQLQDLDDTNTILTS